MGGAPGTLNNLSGLGFDKSLVFAVPFLLFHGDVEVYSFSRVGKRSIQNKAKRCQFYLFTRVPRLLPAQSLPKGIALYFLSGSFSLMF